MKQNFKKMARHYKKSQRKYERITAQKGYEMFKDMTIEEAMGVTVGFGGNKGKNIMQVPVQYMEWTRQNIIGTSLPAPIMQFMYAIDVLFKNCEEKDGFFILPAKQ